MARVAVEAEEQRARVDANLLNRDVELVILHLVLQRRHLLGTRAEDIDLARQVAQIFGVLILHDRHGLPMEPRQLTAVLILHPKIVVAIVTNELALRVVFHLIRAVADDFVGRRIDAPGMIEISRLPHRFEDVRGNYLDADRIKQRRKRLRQMHDDGVVVGRLGNDALVVDGDSGADAVGHLGIVDDVQREQHVASGERLAVKPFHVVAEMKRNRLAVGRDVPFFGQARFGQGGDGIDPDEALEQVAGERARGRVGDQNRVEGARIAGHRGVQDLTGRVIAFRAANAASGKNRERRQHDRGR